MSRRALPGGRGAGRTGVPDHRAVPQKPMAIMARRLCPARWTFRREGMDAGTTQGGVCARMVYCGVASGARSQCTQRQLCTPLRSIPTRVQSSRMALGVVSIRGFVQSQALLEPLGLTRFSTDHWGAETRHLA